MKVNGFRNRSVLVRVMDNDLTTNGKASFATVQMNAQNLMGPTVGADSKQRAAEQENPNFYLNTSHFYKDKTNPDSKAISKAAYDAMDPSARSGLVRCANHKAAYSAAQIKEMESVAKSGKDTYVPVKDENGKQIGAVMSLTVDSLFAAKNNSGLIINCKAGNLHPGPAIDEMSWQKNLDIAEAGRKARAAEKAAQAESVDKKSLLDRASEKDAAAIETSSGPVVMDANEPVAEAELSTPF